MVEPLVPRSISRQGEFVGTYDYPMTSNPAAPDAITVVRLVSNKRGETLALFTISDTCDMCTVSGKLTPADVHRDETGAVEAFAAGNRLLVEQTGIGFLGGRVDQIATLERADGHRSLLVLHDLRDVSKTGFKAGFAIEQRRAEQGQEALVAQGLPDFSALAWPSAQFFRRVRQEHSPERQLSLPVTIDALRLAMTMPRLRQDEWSTLALMTLAEARFGSGFAHELQVAMESPQQSRAMARVTFAKVQPGTALGFLTEQLAGPRGMAL